MEKTQPAPAQQSPAPHHPAQPMAQEPASPMKKMDTKKFNAVFAVAAMVAIVLGVGTGYYLTHKPASAKSSAEATQDVKAKTTANDESISKVFTDEPVEGVLRAGGIDGEGTHHLERGAGSDKDIYLLSTVIDLDGFVGKKVRIWGQTLSGQEAAWLMDVGKVKVLE